MLAMVHQCFLCFNSQTAESWDNARVSSQAANHMLGQRLNFFGVVSCSILLSAARPIITTYKAWLHIYIARRCYDVSEA